VDKGPKHNTPPQEKTDMEIPSRTPCQSLKARKKANKAPVKDLREKPLSEKKNTT